MEQRQLLSDGTTASAIGLGCMSFAGFYGPTSLDASHRTLARAYERGVDLLDTANVYGNGVSEEVIGSYLKASGQSFKIATKAAIFRDPDTGQRGFNNKPDYLRQELEGSLRRLGVDHVALYYMHRRDPDIPVEDVMGTLLDFKAEGKIGGIGFSEIAPSTLRRACAVGPVDAVQSEYSLWTRYPELGLLQACAELGTAFVPFSPLCRGMMGEVILDPQTFIDADFRRPNPRFQEPNFSYNMEKVHPFHDFAQELGISTAGLAIAWCLARGSHLIPIPGTRTPEHLDQCLEGADFAMTDEIMAQIEQLLPVGWAHGDRYSDAQWVGPERYC